MTTAGPNIAGAGASSGGGTAWTNPGNITADDASYATCTLTASGTSQALNGTSFGFSIPSGATIDGFLVEIERFSSSPLGSPFNIADSNVQLIKGGTAGGTNKSTGAVWNYTSPTIVSFGGAADLWGQTWTDSDVNASNFGATLSIQNLSGVSTRTGSVDYIRITVYYTASGGSSSATNTLMMMGCGI